MGPVRPLYCAHAAQYRMPDEGRKPVAALQAQTIQPGRDAGRPKGEMQPPGRNPGLS